MFNTEDADYMMEMLKNQIAATSCMMLATHANLKLQRNPIIETGSKKSKICELSRTVIRFY